MFNVKSKAIITMITYLCFYGGVGYNWEYFTPVCRVGLK